MGLTCFFGHFILGFVSHSCFFLFVFFNKFVLFCLVACCSKLGASSCFDSLLFVLVAFCVYYFALLMDLVSLCCCLILLFHFEIPF
jgi:hypothetical protein